MVCMKCGSEINPLIKIRCRNCGKRFKINEGLICPKCGTTHTGIICEKCSPGSSNKKGRWKLLLITYCIAIPLGTIFAITLAQSEPTDNSETNTLSVQQENTFDSSVIEINLRKYKWVVDNGLSEATWQFNNGRCDMTAIIYSSGQIMTAPSQSYEIKEGEILLKFNSGSNVSIPYSYENGELNIYVDGIKAQKR